MYCIALRAAAGLVLCLLISLTAVAQDESRSEAIYRQWEEVSSLRARGQFEQAIELLGAIITEAGNSPGVLRRAYNHAVFTSFLNKDDDLAARYARQALERFPDLTADPAEFPPRVNELYAALRGEMFGSLVITKPEGGRVQLDGEERGQIPLELELVPIGEHDLVVAKGGHDEYAERILIEPAVRHSVELSLARQRDTRWWLYRIGPTALAGVALVLALGGDEQAADVQVDTPLSEPPDPPGR